MAAPGVDIARRTCPEARFEVLPANREILCNLQEEPFDAVYSIEVIEHLYDPRGFVAGCFSAVKPGGTFIVSTPYHGYLKNLALSLTNGWPKHANPLFDGGHIKFFDRKSLTLLLKEAGFEGLEFSGVGRLPYLWKSIVVRCTRPTA